MHGFKKPEKGLLMSSDMAIELPVSINVVWHHVTATRVHREAQNVYCGAMILGSGKSY